MTYDYDLFVIGGGSGGVRAARVAAQHGARVALAEEYRMGGTCVIRGCVPKKLMVFASAFPSIIENARAYGWRVQNDGFDWTAFRSHLHEELDRLETVYRGVLTRAGVTIHDLRATVAGANSVRLADGAEVTARYILVATGGSPSVPETCHGKPVMTSNDVFLMNELPSDILIVGGGYIACEFACILAGMGVKVTQYYRGGQILRGFDDEARALVAEQMMAHGIEIKCNTDVADLSHEGDGFRVTATTGDERRFTQVLMATGRRPNTARLGLQEAGVKVTARGAIAVDRWSQSSVPSIYAVGDVTDRLALTPVAIREGQAFADTVFGGQDVQADHELVASAVFTRPELGSVGLSEEDARAREPVEIFCTTFRAMHSAFAGRPDRVLMKLVVSKATRRVLGCHIVADNAGEMIQLAAVAVKMGATKEDFDRTVAVHPTMAEEIVTMRSPARSS